MVDTWVFVLLFSDFCIFEIVHKCILLNQKDNEFFPYLGKSVFYVSAFVTCVLFFPQIYDRRSLCGTRQKREGVVSKLQSPTVKET